MSYWKIKLLGLKLMVSEYDIWHPDMPLGGGVLTLLILAYRFITYLDFKSSLKSTCKESTKRCNDRAEESHGQRVELHGIHPYYTLLGSTLWNTKL